jgi:diacylglycerol kinase (ATP)
VSLPAQGGSPRIALLANPRSGAGDASEVQHDLEARGATVERFAISEHEAAAASAADRIAIAGGDGSIGCAAEAAASAGVPLAVIPVGTANDFARALELPTELEDACRLAVEGSDTRRLDLGRMDARPFVNVASAGLAPVAARAATGFKRALGPVAYAVGAVRAGFVTSPLRCRVRCDGDQVFAGRAWQLTVACSGAFGAGASVDADPADGELDVVAIEATSRLALVRRAYGLRAGRLEAQRGVASGRGSEVSVDVPEGTPFNVDGEIVEAGASRFAIEPAAFEVVVG